jgi:hypothetical protein
VAAAGVDGWSFAARVSVWLKDECALIRIRVPKYKVVLVAGAFGMGKLCKKMIDRKGAFPPHAITHALDNGNQYAPQSKSGSKLWPDPW